MKCRWKGCFRRSKLQNFLRLPTMVDDRIFRHIPTDRPEFVMTAKKWNYLITMTAGIQNVISSAASSIWHIVSLLLKFCCYIICVKADEIYCKIWEIRKMLVILYSNPYNNLYALWPINKQRVLFHWVSSKITGSYIKNQQDEKLLLELKYWFTKCYMIS